MKVKELISILKTVNDDEDICIQYDGEYVSLWKEHVQRIYKKNGYQGILLNPTHQEFKGIVPLIKQD